MLFLVGTCHAQDIQDVKISIGEDGYSIITETIVFKGEGEYVVWEFDFEPKELVVNDGIGPLDVSVGKENGIDRAIITFREYQEIDDSDLVEIRYGTHGITKKEEDKWKLSYSSKATPRKTIVKFVFPKDTQIESIEPQESLRSYIEDGIWFYPQEDVFNYSIGYRYVTQRVSPQDNETKSTVAPIVPDEPGSIWMDARTFYGIVLLVLGLVVGIIVYVLYRHNLLRIKGKAGDISVNIAQDVVAESSMINGEVTYNIKPGYKDGKREVKESILKMLSENELSIIRLLQDSEEDEITQAYIHKTTGIPKSSLSDILKHIEKRKILERRVQGRVKWIKLKPWVFV